MVLRLPVASNTASKNSPSVKAELGFVGLAQLHAQLGAKGDP